MVVAPLPLHIHGLTHTLPKPARTLYRDLNLTFAAGAFTGVIGPNGAGKSTLLRELAGVRLPQQGSIRAGDDSLQALSGLQRAQRVAYLPQNTPLYHDLMVQEVVMLGRSPWLRRFELPSARDHQVVTSCLARVGATHLRHRGVMSLSGGELQRVMLARMLATETPILILDEPTTSLDVGHALTVLEHLRALASAGRTVVVAMHELHWARRYADWVLCLSSAGESLWGNTNDVMKANPLGTIFKVRVEELGNDITFYPEGSTGDDPARAPSEIE